MLIQSFILKKVKKAPFFKQQLPTKSNDNQKCNHRKITKLNLFKFFFTKM